MIKPRPTIHISADPFGLYTIGNRQDDWGRPPADCPRCGCHMSRSRSLGDKLCAPCQLAIRQPVEPLELHPIPPAEMRDLRPNTGTVCPGCGYQKDRRSAMCRKCRWA